MDRAPTDPTTPSAAPPPVRRQIVVATHPARAFELWTDRIGDWWPLGTHGVFGADATVAFADGALVETSPTGETSPWGEVLDWVPGERFRLTWHPGGDPGRPTEVEVCFEPVPNAAAGGPHTLVTLAHRGRERLADPEGSRADYAGGWSTVIGLYGAMATADRDTWLALSHAAGPGPSPSPETGEAAEVTLARRAAENGA